MFKVYDKTYISEKFGIEERTFHRKVKPQIIKDFKKELDEINLRNPDIGLNDEGLIYLVDANDSTIFFETRQAISAYIE